MCVYIYIDIYIYTHSETILSFIEVATKYTHTMKLDRGFIWRSGFIEAVIKDDKSTDKPTNDERRIRRESDRW